MIDISYVFNKKNVKFIIIGFMVELMGQESGEKKKHRQKIVQNPHTERETKKER